MTKKYKIEGTKKSVTCQSLTFGYMYDVEQGVVEESIMSAVLDGTDLDEKGIRSLTRVQVNEIWEIVKQLTYPELYNEDGSPKEFDLEDEVDDKKKA